MKTTTVRSTLIAFAFTLLASVSVASAGEIAKQEHNQQARIAEGIESGQLTPAEAARLESREAELKKQIAEDRNANGGKLTKAERHAANKELKDISRRIHHAKHNKKTTAPAK